MKLQGIIPPVVTPMTADQELDLNGLHAIGARNRGTARVSAVGWSGLPCGRFTPIESTPTAPWHIPFGPSSSLRGVGSSPAKRSAGRTSYYGLG